MDYIFVFFLGTISTVVVFGMIDIITLKQEIIKIKEQLKKPE